MSREDTTGADFWSRRKQAVRAAEEAEQRAVEDAEAAGRRAALEERSDAEILEELQLPDPDDLTSEDDVSQFLSAAVPERLRRRALRKLWTLNPVLANVDGLVDYADDFTDAATVISDLQTVYQVGKGMIDRFAAALDDAVDSDADSAKSPENELETSNGAAHKENPAAEHVDYKNNGTTSIQLTQRESVLQDEVKHVVTAEFESGGDLEPEFKAPSRRRVRFDYS